MLHTVCTHVCTCTSNCNLVCFMPLTQPLQVLHLGLSTEASREPHRIQHPPGQGHTSCVRYPPPSVPYQEQEAAEGHAEVRRKGFQRYQIKFNSSPLSVVLSIPPSRVLSALAFWSPVFGEADYLPHLAFPFAKLFQNNRLLAFEMLATILSKCQTTLVVLSDQVLPSTAVAFEQALRMYVQICIQHWPQISLSFLLLSMHVLLHYMYSSLCLFPS